MGRVLLTGVHANRERFDGFDVLQVGDRAGGVLLDGGGELGFREAGGAPDELDELFALAADGGGGVEGDRPIVDQDGRGEAEYLGDGGGEAVGHALEAEIVGMDAVDDAVEVGGAEESQAVEEVEVLIAGGDCGFDHLPNVLAHGGEAGGVSGCRDGGDRQDGGGGVFGAEGFEKGLVDGLERFEGRVVLGEVEDEEGGVEFGDHGGYRGFAFAVAGEAEVDEIEVELAAEDGLVAEAGAAGAAALGDGGSVVDDGLGAGEAGGGGDGGGVIKAEAVDGHGFVQGEIEGDFAVLRGEVGEEDELGCLAFGGVFGGDGGGAVDAVEIEVDAGLAEGVHVGHVRRAGVFEVDREAGRVRAKADAASGGGEAEAPDGGGKGGFEASGESDEFVLVFGEPGEAVDEEAGILDR